ncbi:MAG: Gfo/Idh/MocA family oxidoreductase [Verrucomicrobiota bacterium]
MKVKIGMIGAGRMGTRHLAILKKIEEIEICGVADLVEASRNKVAAEFGIKAYSAINDLLEKEKPDAVYITTPIGMHLENIKTAFKAGAHVFCEKPLVASNKEGEELLLLAKKHKGKIIFTGLAWRYAESTQAIKAAVQNGVIGEVRQFRVACGGPSVGKRPPWFEDRKIAVRGGMLDTGVHFFDMVAWTLGSDFDAVYAFNDQTEEKIDVNSSITTRLSNGIIGSMQFTSETPMSNLVEYFGKGGVISFGFGNEFTIKHPGEADKVVKTGNNDRFLNMSRDFIRTIIEGNDSPISVVEALRATAVAEAGYKSSETGKSEKVATVVINGKIAL